MVSWFSTPPLKEVETAKPPKKEPPEDEDLEIWDDDDDDENTVLDFDGVHLGKKLIELILQLRETILKMKP